jgi:predicted metal-dependent hydrolase
MKGTLAFFWGILKLKSGNPIDCVVADCTFCTETLSHKSTKIAALVECWEGQSLDPHYLGFFDCFNKQRFFEAHEVLEELWLSRRGTPKAMFYQALIQLAGAFVHVQKTRLGPAASLFRLANKNLERYMPTYEDLDVADVRNLISQWLSRLEDGASAPCAFLATNKPQLSLKTACAIKGNKAL